MIINDKNILKNSINKIHKKYFKEFNWNRTLLSPLNELTEFKNSWLLSNNNYLHKNKNILNLNDYYNNNANTIFKDINIFKNKFQLFNKNIIENLLISSDNFTLDNIDSSNNYFMFLFAKEFNKLNINVYNELNSFIELNDCTEINLTIDIINNNNKKFYNKNDKVSDIKRVENIVNSTFNLSETVKSNNINFIANSIESQIVIFLNNSNISINSTLNHINDLYLTIVIDNKSNLYIKNDISNSNINIVSYNSFLKLAKINNCEFNIYLIQSKTIIENINFLNNNSIIYSRNLLNNNLKNLNFKITLLTLLKSNVYYTLSNKFEKFAFLDREGYIFCPTLVIDTDIELKRKNIVDISIIYTIAKRLLLFVIGLYALLFCFQESDQLDTDYLYTYYKYNQIKLINDINIFTNFKK